MPDQSVAGINAPRATAQDLAEQQLEEFCGVVRGRLKEAERAGKMLAEEREKVGEQFKRREQAIQQTIDMCRAALEQDHRPKTAEPIYADAERAEGW